MKKSWFFHQNVNDLIQLCLGIAEGDILSEERVEDDVLADPPLDAAVALRRYVDPDRLGLVVFQGEGEGVRARSEDGGKAGLSFSGAVRICSSNFFAWTMDDPPCLNLL